MGVQVERAKRPDGRRKHRRMVVGSVDEFTNELAARQAIVGLRLVSTLVMQG